MAKTIDFGTVGVAEMVSWKGTLDDLNLGPGETTQFHLEVTRPADQGPLAAPGLTVNVILFPFGGGVSIDPPGPNFGADTGNTFAAGETHSIDFQITNDPAGASPAAYTIFPFISWSNGTVAEGPFVFPAGFPVP